MSSSTNSPQRFSGTYDSFYTDAAAAAAATNEQDFNNKMKVPKRIRVTGEHDDSPTVNWANYNKAMPGKLSMNVPERIMVAGGENLIASRGVPREFELEDSMLPRPPDPRLYRVNTPPRTITLNSYTPQEEDTPSSPRSTSSHPPSHPNSFSGVPSVNSRTVPYGNGLSYGPPPSNHMMEDDSSPVMGQAMHPLASQTPSTVGPGEELTPTEELQLLRRQVGRLNRRIMALELDAQQRSHREMIVYSLGVAYCLLRSIIWLNRN